MGGIVEGCAGSSAPSCSTAGGGCPGYGQLLELPNQFSQAVHFKNTKSFSAPGSAASAWGSGGPFWIPLVDAVDQVI